MWFKIKRTKICITTQYNEGKKKPLEILSASDLGIDTTPRVQQIKVEEPPKRKAGIKVANVAELVSKLKNEAKVI